MLLTLASTGYWSNRLERKQNAIRNTEYNYHPIYTLHIPLGTAIPYKPGQHLGGGVQAPPPE